MDKKDLHFLDLAFMVSELSTCLDRKVGCVIVSERRSVLTTGYNGAPRNCPHPDEVGCPCQTNPKAPYNERRCAHAEANAIAQAAAEGTRLQGGTAYCLLEPCASCARLLINAGIKRVVVKYNKQQLGVREEFAAAGVDLSMSKELKLKE